MSREQIEKRIRELLDSDANYWDLSEQLFGPNGWFGKMGATVEERTLIGRSPLFKEAQERIRDMEYAIAEKLRHNMKEQPITVARSIQSKVHQ